MSNQHIPQVIGIASGKGGVGKTTVSTNLATALVHAGKRVLLMDADMGMANAQIALGCKATYNIGHVLRGEKSLKEILVKSSQGAFLVPGASGMRELAAMDDAATAGIIAAFDDLADDFDVVIVDVAAGISPSVLTFLAACHRRFIVVKDEPASIADAYGIIKVMTRDYDLNEIYLVPNMVPSQALGWQLYRRLNEVCHRFLSQSVAYLTSIEADEFVLQALRKYTSVIQHAPGGAASRDFHRLADAVMKLPPVAAPNGHIQFFVNRLAQSAEEG